MTTIVWFRNDLRLADNPALADGVRQGDIIPLFIWDDSSADIHYGSAAKWWLHYSLDALDQSLKERGSRLLIRRGKPADILPKVIAESDAHKVVWNRRYDPQGIATDTKLKAALVEMNIEVESFNGNLLMEPWELKTKTGGPYKVFSPFWKNLISHPRPLAPIAAPGKLSHMQLGTERLEDLELRPKLSWADGFGEYWTPGHHAAQEALDAFAASTAPDYNALRNLPAKPGTSRLSPRLRFGELSPRQVWQSIESHHPNALEGEGTEAYLREIGWREFAYHLIYHFPETIEAPLRPQFERFPWRDAPEELKRWQKGTTGFPIVDAGMRELWHTGWMHNRVRMIVASFLVKNLLISWQEGAAWFFDTLVDGDLASNTLGWQWAGGCGADAAPYFRIFNPMSQSEKFDGEGDYIRKWVPEIGSLSNKWIHRPFEAKGLELQLQGIKLGETYPEPIGEHKLARERALRAFDVVKGAA